MATRAERIRQIRAGQRIARASSSSSAAEVAAAGSPGAGRKDRNESETAKAKAKAGANAAAAMRAKGQRAATYRSLKGGSFEGGVRPRSQAQPAARAGAGGRPSWRSSAEAAPRQGRPPGRRPGPEVDPDPGQKRASPRTILSPGLGWIPRPNRGRTIPAASRGRGSAPPRRTPASRGACE